MLLLARLRCAAEYACAPSYEPPTVSQPDPQAVPARYVVRFAGPAACGAAPGGLSHDTAKVFDDMHDGDQKQIALLNGTSIVITPHGNKQRWKVAATLGDDCTASIDFNVPGKPNPPPVNLLASFRQFAQPWGTVEFKSLVVFTDPSGKLAPASKPLNAWLEDAAA